MNSSGNSELSLHQLLKTGTADLHAMIEEKSLMSELLQPDISEDRYVFILKKMLAFYQALEGQLKAVDQIEKIIPDYAERFKSPSLEKDIQNLNQTPGDKLAHFDMEIFDISTAVGVLYVIEGSSLGGQVIAKKLKEHPFIQENRLNFFMHYGAKTGFYWRNFLHFIEVESPRLNHSQVLAGARAAFMSLSRHLAID